LLNDLNKLYFSFPLKLLASDKSDKLEIIILVSKLNYKVDKFQLSSSIYCCCYYYYLNQKSFKSSYIGESSRGEKGSTNGIIEENL
jgi:hypothetical protein